jgi:hypothetical protein
MTSRLWIAAAAAAALTLGACGAEIGDSCFSSIDCSTTGDRICDTTQEDGYCTVLGCDYDTCPEESVCVRFVVGSFENVACDPLTEDLEASNATDDCSLNELCTLAGTCVPRSAEIRYCMRTCGDGGDCRDGYECRGRDLMLTHGGEPVLAPGERPSGELQAFCAAAPVL